MRIDMVSEHASPLALLGRVDAGGQNVHVAELAKALGRLGVEVVVHTRRDDPRLPRRVRLAANVIVDHVSAGPPVPLAKDDLYEHMGQFAAELEQRWKARRPDVVHSHFWMSGLASMQAARSVGVPVMHTYHALGVVKRRQQGPADPSPAQRLEVEEMLARHADRIIATSADEAFELLQMGGRPDHINVVPCGVDLELFRPGGPSDPRPTDRPRVVIVGRLVERKGIGNVMTALRMLDEAELVIAGGPPKDELHRDVDAMRLMNQARSLGIEHRVDFRGGLARERVPALLRSADVVACCPWYEPFGLVAVEAMACGKPVVASAVGGLAETVLDGRTGLHVPPREPVRIAQALARLLDDADLRRSFGRASARRALRYGWPRVAQETLAVARSLAPPAARVAGRAERRTA